MEATLTPAPVDSALREVFADSRGGKPVGDEERVLAFRQLAGQVNLPTYVHLLPLLLNLNGRPYTLEDHFPMETAFAVRLPQHMLFKSARQVTKSTTMAARIILLSNAIPHFAILVVTPLYEQVQRFSNNYVRPLIEQSPVKHMWMGTGTENRVLQRSFKNCSKVYFSFAFLDADRIRGVSAHMCTFDEVQDLDHTLLPIIRETMSHSKWRLNMYTGTPKTVDNTIERLWQRSSRAEWCVPCFACGKLNIPRTGYDLERMIGPCHDDIGPARVSPEDAARGVRPGVPAVICASSKCGRPVDPARGRWYHEDESKKLTHPGYHIPQVVMPLHYADKKMWAELLGKQAGSGNTTTAQFYNEVLGESYDVGTKLITETELRRAATLPWLNNPRGPREAVTRKGDYLLRVLGVDWGGGGDEEVSFTTAAVLGYRGDGRVDVLYGRRLLNPQDHMREAAELLHIFNMFDCHFLAHDYNGSGTIRETLMVQSGLPYDRVIPLVYFATATKNLIVFHKSENVHSRNYWQLDKARALLLVCNCLKLRVIQTFQYDFVSEDEPGLLSDFLALQENKIEMARGRDIYTVVRNPHFTDDFAHAVTFAACTIWHNTGNWPNLASLAGLQMTAEEISRTNPPTPWEDHGDY